MKLGFRTLTFTKEDHVLLSRGEARIFQKSIERNYQEALAAPFLAHVGLSLPEEVNLKKKGDVVQKDNESARVGRQKPDSTIEWRTSTKTGAPSDSSLHCNRTAGMKERKDSPAFTVGKRERGVGEKGQGNQGDRYSKKYAEFDKMQKTSTAREREVRF